MTSAERVEFKCITCGANASGPARVNDRVYLDQSISYESFLRVAGWRFGRVGEEPVVICLLCSGEKVIDPDEETEEERTDRLYRSSWWADCRTCGASMRDDMYDNPKPATEEDANDWRVFHDCEPEVVVTSPQDRLEQAMKRPAARPNTTPQVKVEQRPTAVTAPSSPPVQRVKPKWYRYIGWWRR